MWDMIVSVPDHCLSFYFSHQLSLTSFQKESFVRHWMTMKIVSASVDGACFTDGIRVNAEEEEETVLLLLFLVPKQGCDFCGTPWRSFKYFLLSVWDQ